MRWRPQASPTRGTPGRIPVIANRVQVLAIHWKRVWIASSAMQQERYVSCVQARTARVTTSHPRSSSTAPHRRVPVPSMCPAAASCRAGWLQRPRSGTCNSTRARFHRCAPQPAEWQSAHRNAGRLRAVPSESGEGKKGAERRVRCAKLHLQNYFCRTYTPHQFRGQRVENGPPKAGKKARREAAGALQVASQQGSEPVHDQHHTAHDGLGWSLAGPWRDHLDREVDRERTQQQPSAVELHKP